MTALWRLGVVHGDLSTYNLLWTDGRVIVIDFPQSMDRAQPGAHDVLAQDAASLALSFRKLGVEVDPEALLARVTAEA